MGILRPLKKDEGSEHIDEEKDYSPTTKEKRATIWDSMRRRFNLKPQDITNKKNLIEKIQKKAGLKPYEKPKGKVKSIIALIKKSDFHPELKKELKTVKGYSKTVEGKKIKVPGYLKLKQKTWSKGEENVLKTLKQRYKGRTVVRMRWGKGYKEYTPNEAIVRRFREMTHKPRSVSSILTKKSRL